MKLGLGICNYQTHVHSYFLRSILNIQSSGPIQIFWGNHPLDVARNNQIIMEFLKSDCDVFVKMDTDQWYPSDYFNSMCPLIDEYKVIGPLIYDRNPNTGFMPLCKKKVGEKPFLPPSEAYDGKTGIEAVENLHTNCFFSRTALQAISPPYYEDLLDSTGTKRIQHVDHTFMQKLRNAGFPTYVNFDVVVRHIAEIPISREFYERYNG